MQHDQPDNLYAAIEHCAQTMTDSGVFFGHGTDNAWDEAVQLVLHACDAPMDISVEQAQQSLSASQWSNIQTMLRQRIVKGLPLPYITGQSLFADLLFKVDERAIIPRSPMAELIENGFSPWWLAPDTAPRILDLCCGGGAIGIATAVHLPDSQVDMVDIDPDALALAQENIDRHGVGDRVQAIASDLFSALAGKCYHLIVSNPPYVDAADLSSMPREYHHEPALALGSGKDGLSLSRAILANAADHLLPGGCLILEVGNSWPALEAAFPTTPFMWIELERGGHGVCVLQAQDLPASHK